MSITYTENNLLLQKRFMLNQVTQFPIQTNYMFTKMFAQKTSGSNVVFWDIIYNNGGLAQYIEKGGEPYNVGGLSFGRTQQEVSYKKEAFEFNSNEIKWRTMPGSSSSNERENLNGIIELMKSRLVGRADARVEKECLSALRGSWTYTTVENRTVSIDYNMPSSNSIELEEAGDVWSNTEADILGDIKAWKKLLRGCTNPKLIVSPTVMEYIVANETILGSLTDVQKQATILSGTLALPIQGVEIVVYDAAYLPAHPTADISSSLPPTEVKFMADNEVFLVGQSVNNEPLYERYLVECYEADGKAQRFMNFFQDKEKGKNTLIVGEYSLPILRNPYSVVHATVAASS